MLIAASSLAQAATKPDSEIQQAVETMINARHPTDTAESWRALGPTAPALIQRMYASDTSIYHRMRLLEGLGAFTDDPSALAFIQKQAEETPHQVVRNAAIRSVGRNQAARSEEWVAKYLSHEDPHTRKLAAEMLGQMGSPSAVGKVEAHLKEEKTPWVVAAIRGEAPKTFPPKASGSTEDRLSADLSGEWKGYWLEPQSKPSEGMKSEAIEVSIQLRDKLDAPLEATLRIKSAAAERTKKLSGASGKGLRWQGSWVEEFPAAKAGQSPRRELTPVEATLSRRSGELILEIRSTTTAGIGILRRVRAP